MKNGHYGRKKNNEACDTIDRNRFKKKKKKISNSKSSSEMQKMIHINSKIKVNYLNLKKEVTI